MSFWVQLRQYLESQSKFEPHQVDAIMSSMREMHQKFISMMSLDDVERLGVILKRANGTNNTL
jgi:hypothetical protein